MVGEKWLPPPGQMPPSNTTRSFENMQVMQRLLNKKIRVKNFLEAAQYIMVLVQNVKIFTILCTNDWSFGRNRLLFAHIPSPWLFWTNFTLFCTEIGDQDFTYIELLVSLQLWNEINKVQIWYKLVTCYVVLIKFIKNRYCSKYLHIAYSWIPLP